MTHKLRQQRYLARRIPSSRLPSHRAQTYLAHYFRHIRTYQRSAPLKAAFALVHWRVRTRPVKQKPIARRASCPITGRDRGISQRFGVTRTKVKHLSSENLLIGLRKSSW